MTLERPDLDEARRFFVDFGLHPVESDDDTLRLSGAAHGAVLVSVVRGPEARLRGLSLAVSAPDLVALATLDEACGPTADGLHGGPTIRLRDPTGRWIDAVALRARAIHGETARETVEARQRLNAPLRIEPEPPAIRRLGHVALEAVDFDRVVEWYIRVFGFLPSDVQVLDDDSPGLVFLRCDRGAEPVEHHTLVLARSVEDTMSHAAFAVDGLDALAMGQRVLRERGWTHGWGIGRHLMGSQIFDYWRDPWGRLMEHYADSDLFDASHEPAVLPMSRAAMAQWGPPMPAHFVDTRLTPRKVLTVVRNLRREPSLTLRRVLQLKRAMDP